MDKFSFPKEELVLEVVEKYTNTVYRLAFSRTKSSHDAEDIMQNVFMKFIKYDIDFKSEEHIKAWLIKVTINLSKNLLTSAWFRKTTTLEDDVVVTMKEENEYSNSENNKTNDNVKEEAVKKGVYVPKQQLGVIDPNLQAYRIATLVYKGRIYTIEGTEISLEEGKVLMDKKNRNYLGLNR